MYIFFCLSSSHFDVWGLSLYTITYICLFHIASGDLRLLNKLSRFIIDWENIRKWWNPIGRCWHILSKQWLETIVRNVSIASWTMFQVQLARTLAFCRNFTKQLWKHLKKQRMRLDDQKLCMQHFVPLHLSFLWSHLCACHPLCRDCGSRQIWSSARYFLKLVNMDGWVRCFVY